MKKDVETKNNKLIVYKQNPIIKGYFTEREKKDIVMPNEFDLDVLNALYGHIQKKLFDIEPQHYKNYKQITISELEIRKILSSANSKFNSLLKESIKNIYNTDIMLKNFVDPITGKKAELTHIRIISQYSYDNGEYILNFNELFFVNILRHKTNYTKIDIFDSKSLKSKYAKRLFEYLKSMAHRKTSFSMSLDDLNKLFGTNYLVMSRISQTLKRVHETISEIIPYTYEVFKRDKLVSFSYVDDSTDDAQDENTDDIEESNTKLPIIVEKAKGVHGFKDDECFYTPFENGSFNLEKKDGSTMFFISEKQLEFFTNNPNEFKQSTNRSVS